MSRGCKQGGGGLQTRSLAPHETRGVSRGGGCSSTPHEGRGWGRAPCRSRGPLTTIRVVPLIVYQDSRYCLSTDEDRARGHLEL